MNVADSEVVVSILGESGFALTGTMHEADLILINTCSIRENAELRVWGRLDMLNNLKRKKPGIVVGVIGCMAERIFKEKLPSLKLISLLT